MTVPAPERINMYQMEGIVEVPDPKHMNLYLLEGTVEVTATGNFAVVHAREMAQKSTISIELLTFSPNYFFHRRENYFRLFRF